EDTDRSLENLRARKAQLEKDKKPDDPKLDKQVRQFEKAQKDNEDAIKRYNAERDEVKTRFDGDLARYNELRGVKATKPATATAVPSVPATAAPAKVAPAKAAPADAKKAGG